LALVLFVVLVVATSGRLEVVDVVVVVVVVVAGAVGLFVRPRVEAEDVLVLLPMRLVVAWAVSERVWKLLPVWNLTYLTCFVPVVVVMVVVVVVLAVAVKVVVDLVGMARC